MAAATSPYDPGSQEATYWQARQRLASATRALNEKLVSTDIDPELAAALTEKIEGLDGGTEPSAAGYRPGRYGETRSARHH